MWKNPAIDQDETHYGDEPVGYIITPTANEDSHTTKTNEGSLMLGRIRNLLKRKPDPADTLIQTVLLVVKTQIMLASKAVPSIARDPWAAGYCFGVCMVTMETIGFDMNQVEQGQIQIARTMIALFEDKDQGIAFCEFIGKVTNTDLSVRGIVAAQKDMEAFYQKGLTPVRLSVWLTDHLEFEEAMKRKGDA